MPVKGHERRQSASSVIIKRYIPALQHENRDTGLYRLDFVFWERVWTTIDSVQPLPNFLFYEFLISEFRIPLGTHRFFLVRCSRISYYRMYFFPEFLISEMSIYLNTQGWRSCEALSRATLPNFLFRTPYFRISYFPWYLRLRFSWVFVLCDALEFLIAEFLVSNFWISYFRISYYPWYLMLRFLWVSVLCDAPEFLIYPDT